MTGNVTTKVKEEGMTSVSLSSDGDHQGIARLELLTAAAGLGTDASTAAVEDPRGADTDSKVDREEGSPLPGISTLLEVATTMVSPAKPSNKKRSQSSDGSHDEELVGDRPRKRIALFDGDESLYPTQDELEVSNTRRGRNALFSWYERLRDLYSYKKEHGHCMVPQKYATNHALGIWVNKQRMEKRLKDQGLKSTMTERRLALLDKAGFHWAKHKGQVSWDQKYQELKTFYEKNGHCNVPTKYRENSALGRWISTQRAQVKEWRRGEKTSMTLERYNKLCSLDFQFERLASKKRSDSRGEESSEAQDRDEAMVRVSFPPLRSCQSLLAMH